MCTCCVLLLVSFAVTVCNRRKTATKALKLPVQVQVIQAYVLFELLYLKMYCI